LLLRIDKTTGRIVWTREVGRGQSPPRARGAAKHSWRGQQFFHATQTLASPSPVVDGETVIAHFGNGDLAAYDFEGNPIWKRNLADDYGKYTIWWGHANSPVLDGNLVISVCMQDSCADLWAKPSPSYVVAHDKRTGRQRWKVLRMTAATGESCDSYTTPIFRDLDGRREMIVWGGQVLDAYDPASGRRLWHLSGLIGNRVIPSPVAAEGMIFAIQGMREPLLAIRPEGDGEQSRKSIVWDYSQGTSDSPSPVVWAGQLYMVSNDGILRALDVHSGRLLWKERLRGGYRASPIAAEGRVYFLNTEGRTTVISASARFDRLTENQLDAEHTFASPAVSDGKLYLRSRRWLYCIGR
jgi:outer membrane protein assembly factor BamB